MLYFLRIIIVNILRFINLLIGFFIVLGLIGSILEYKSGNVSIWAIVLEITLLILWIVVYIFTRKHRTTPTPWEFINGLFASAFDSLENFWAGWWSDFRDFWKR